jgi:hypothetical protein
MVLVAAKPRASDPAACNSRNHPTMRAFLFFLPVVLASCGQVVTQHEILQQSRVELARRETWSDQAIIVVRQSPDDWRMTWRVSAGYFDYSEVPGGQGLRVVPGTERELRFTRDGCLLGYSNPTSRCLTPRDPNAVPAPAGGAAPAK